MCICERAKITCKYVSILRLYDCPLYKLQILQIFLLFTLPLLNNRKKDSIPQKKKSDIVYNSRTIPIRILMMNTLSPIREPIAHFYIYIYNFFSYKASDKLNNLKTKSRFMSQLLSPNDTEKFYNI